MPESKHPSLVVLAAGMGSRYGGLKQIDPVGPGGETLLDYSVYDALRAGFGSVVFVIRRAIEQEFRAVVGARFEGRVDTRYAFQELESLPAGFRLPETRTKPWGTTHAVLAARDSVDGVFAAINADDFYGAASFESLGEELRKDNTEHALVGFTLKNTLSEHGSVARGICKVREDGLLEEVKELTKIERDGEAAKYTDEARVMHALTGNEIASMNFWGFRRSVFAQFEELFEEFLQANIDSEKAEYYLTAAVSELIMRNLAQVRVLRTTSQWLGVTYREDRPSVQEGIARLIASGQYPERLWG